jgi:hypothetical protein
VRLSCLALRWALCICFSAISAYRRAFSKPSDTIEASLEIAVAMQKYAILSIMALSLMALPCHAVEINVSETLVLGINVLEGWTLYLDPPDALVKETARHVAHQPAAATATIEQIENAARKLLAANEAFVYHAASGAHLDIDFSPLDPGASAPTSKGLHNSADFAAESLAREEAVTDVVSAVSPFEIDGVREAFQLAAEYTQHHLPMKFLGIIGYVDDYMFYLYYTDPGKDPAVFDEMQDMLGTVTVRPSGH